MADRLLATLRTPEGIKGLISQRPKKFIHAPGRKKSKYFRDFYEITEVPVDGSAFAVMGDTRRLMDSWERLSKVERWDGETLFHLLIVLIETDPVYPDSNIKLPPLDLEPEPARPRATAAHPRGARELRRKVAKTKKKPAFDLRPYLCARKHVSALLKQLRPFWPSEFRRLAALGYEVDSLSRDPRKWSDSLDPYFVVHHGWTKGIKQLKLPAQFVRLILPSLKGLPWSQVNDYLAAYWDLALETNPPLLEAVSRLINLNVSGGSLKWLRFLSTRPPDRRLSLTVYLIEMRAYFLHYAQYPMERVERLFESIPEDHFHKRIHAFFNALRKGVNLDYLEHGFQLADRYSPNYAFDNIGKGTKYAAEEVDLLLSHLYYSKDVTLEHAMSFWEKCGRDQWFNRIINIVDWLAIPSFWAYRIINILQESMDTGRVADREIERRDFIEWQVYRMIAALRRINHKFHASFFMELTDYYWYWDLLDPAQIKRYMDAVYILLDRLCRKPFETTPRMTSMLGYFIDLTSPELRKKFLQAPDSSFANLQKAFRSENRKTLISRGLLAMLKENHAFTVNCFIHFPNQLFKLAKDLGILPLPLRHSAMKQFQTHPLMKEVVDSLDPFGLSRYLRFHLGSSFKIPFPKKLTEYVEEKITLTENRIRKYLEEARINLFSTRLEVLERVVLKTLKKDFSVDEEEEAWKHALQFVSVIDENRRPLKRFIRAYSQGDRDYIDKHPNTKAWLRKHKRVRADLWKQGIKLSGITSKYGNVLLKLEQNPLEALKIGAYAGSCLGLGGDYTYSAAAVALDINKQVVYARNLKNRVIARQLLALSKKNQLVCFQIYPHNVSREIKDLFCEYDIRFANHLKLPLFQEKPETPGPYPVKLCKGQDSQNGAYEIESILSQNWYDDWAWDFLE